MTDVLRFHLSCVPPTANHQRKKIVTIKTRDGRQFSKLADKPELLKAKQTLDDLLIPHQRTKVNPATGEEVGDPVLGPVVVHLEFTWPWLSTHSKRTRALGRIPHTSKPDLTNAAKTLEDRLVDLLFIEDDRKVVDLRCTKWWGDNPGITITISPFTVTPAHVPHTAGERCDLFAAVPLE